MRTHASAGQEMLSQRLRKEGRLHIDLLQRFGEDLLDVVNYLEEQGIPHRDIKPDNIGVGPVGRGDRLHLVLFDFSLSRTPADNIRAGTNRLSRSSAATTEAAAMGSARREVCRRCNTVRAGNWNTAKVGGRKDRSLALKLRDHHRCERFDASVRDSLGEFFQTAFRRDPKSDSTTPRRCCRRGGTVSRYRAARDVFRP